MFFSITTCLYLLTIPVIYTNIYPSHATNFINFMFIMNISLNYEKFLLDTLDNYCRVKIYITSKINNNKNIINNLLYKIGYYKNIHFEYKLLNAHLYTDLSQNYNITSFFNNNYDIDKIDKNLFIQVYYKFNIKFEDNIHIRIKLNFIFCNKEYILYIPYNLKNDNYIQYPPYTNEIMDKYKNNIVIPMHKTYNKKYPIYTFLTMNFREIDECKIYYNDDSKIENIDITDYIKKINTPFNDMGILYDCSIPISWICNDNYINIDDFKKICLKYSNYYFNEEKMELEENIYESNDLNNTFISPILREYIDKKINENK
jgi:hypothetical protein